MPSVLVSFREAKEPDYSRRPYLKSPIKEEGKKGKVRKYKSRKTRKSQVQKRRYTKRGAVKALRRTWFLVIRVPNINKILLKRNFKSKRRLLVKMPT